MFSHHLRQRALIGAVLIGPLVSAALVVQAATVGVQLAPGLTPDERAAIERQVSATLGISGQAQACDATSRDSAPCNVPEAATDAGVPPPPRPMTWQTTPVEPPRESSNRPLNREEAMPLAGWMYQLRVDAERYDDQRPLLVLVRNGQVQSAWLWRDDVPLDTAPLVLRSERHDHIESGAVLGHFFRHAVRLEPEALHWLPRQWQGLGRDGWHILRFGDLYRGVPRLPPRSPLSAPSPWEFSR